MFATTKLADKKVGGGAVKEINVLITAPGGEEVLNGQGEGEGENQRAVLTSPSVLKSQNHFSFFLKHPSLM